MIREDYFTWLVIVIATVIVTVTTIKTETGIMLLYRRRLLCRQSLRYQRYL